MHPLLEMRGIEKSYPGVRALRGVDLQLAAGEVVALLGENGAGKSTLIKTLSGAVRLDAGSLYMNGEALEVHSPHDAQRKGIAVIYQEFNLVPSLSAVDNIFLGRERAPGGFVARRREREQALELFQRLGVDVDPNVPCHQLTIAQQQIVEIAKALSLDAQIIVMDEPSATLTTQEVERLFEVIRELQAQQIGVIYVSHRLEEIFQIADRIVVLRDGQCVGQRPVNAVSRDEVIELMVGRELSDEFPPRDVSLGAVHFEVRHLCRRGVVEDVSFDVRRGEVLALTGLVGAGRTEAVRLIFGADRPDGGDILLGGSRLAIGAPRDAIRAGIGLLTEDRKLEGLVLSHPIHENFGLPNLGWLSRLWFVKQREEQQALQRFVDLLKIKITHQDQPAATLSGGNQQKVVLAKWLARGCDVLIFDEPTRGIDVGAKYEIYLLINELSAQGKCVIMITSELAEALGMADRILVMHGGRITGQITDVKSATQEQIMQLAVR